MVTYSRAAVVLTILSSASPSTAFSSIDLLIVSENVSISIISLLYSLTWFGQWRINNPDESFQSLDPKLSIFIYVRIVDNSTVALIGANPCFISYLWMAQSL